MGDVMTIFRKIFHAVSTFNLLLESTGELNGYSIPGRNMANLSRSFDAR